MLSCLVLLLINPNSFSRSSLGSNLSLKESKRSHFEGDLPAFYAAGKILAKDYSVSKNLDLKNLYNPALQAEVQNTYFNLGGKYLQFVYPPFSALFFIPLSFLNVWTAKVVSVLFLLSFLIYSVKIYTDLTGYSFMPVFSLALAFFPLFSSLAGTQNSIISLTLFLTTIYFIRLNKAFYNFLAGIFLGFLLFKPQFALILFLALFILNFRFSFVFLSFLLGFIITALGIHFLSVYYFNDNWLFIWLEALGDFSVKESSVNLSQQVSIYGFVKTFFKESNNLVWLLTAILSVFIFFLVYKAEILRSVKTAFKFSPFEKRHLTLEKYFKLGSFTALASPHTMYYDASLILPFLGLILGKTKHSFVYFLIIWVYAALACLYKGELIFQALFLLVLITFFFRLKGKT